MGSYSKVYIAAVIAGDKQMHHETALKSEIIAVYDQTLQRGVQEMVLSDTVVKELHVFTILDKQVVPTPSSLRIFESNHTWALKIKWLIAICWKFNGLM